MKFQELVEEVLQEDVVAGGAGSAFGTNVGATATPFSGDTYAPGDARVAKSLYGGVVTRNGMRKKRNKKRNKKR